MARPVLTAKGTASVVTTNAPAPTYPASVAANDVVILELVKYDAGAGLISGANAPTIANFTLINAQTLFSTTGSTVGYVAWYWRRATGALSGTVSITTTGGTGNSTICIAQLYRVTGCITTGNPYDNFIANTNGGAASAVTWLAIRDYHSAEELPILLSGGASAVTQPPALPVGVTGGLAADSTTTGADAYLLAYQATTPAEPTTGPFASSTSRPVWATLSINFISPSYVGQTAKSGSDTNGTTTESVPRVGLKDSDGQSSSWVSQGTDDFSNSALPQWTDPLFSANTLNAPTGFLVPSNTVSTDGYFNAATMGVGGGKWRISALLSTIASEAYLGITDLVNRVSYVYRYSEASMLDDEMEYWVDNAVTFTDIPATFGGWSNGDTIIMEVDFLLGTISVIRSRGGVETVMWTGSNVGSANISASFAATTAGWNPYVMFLATGQTSIRMDNFSVDKMVVGSMVAESASAVPAGGSTAKSGSDTNGATTEVTSPFIRETGPDTNGGIVESVPSIGILIGDVNGGVNEIVAPFIRQTAPDATGTLIETASLKLAGADVSGGAVETVNEVVQQAITDASAGVVETAGIAVPVSGADTNAGVTEAVTLAANLTGSDVSAAGQDVASPSVTPVGTDASGGGAEGQVLAAQEASTDASAGVIEAQTVASPVTNADTSGATTETTKIGLAGTDTNGATTEQAAQVVAESSADANGGVAEAAKLNLAGVDSNSVTTEQANEVVSETMTDANGVTTETGVLVASEATADANGGATEVTSLRLTGTDTGTDSEAQTLAAQESSADANAGIVESATTNTPKSDTDASGATTEIVNELAKPSGTDAGSDTETATYKYPLAAQADTSTPASDVATPKAVESNADANSVTTETGTPSVPNAVTGTDTGAATDASVVSARYTVTDQSSGVDTALLAAYITSPDGSGSTVETAQTVARIVATELGISVDVSTLQVVVLSPDTGHALVEAAKIGLLGVDSGVGNIEGEAILVTITDDDALNGVDSEILLIHGRVLNPDAPFNLLGVKMQEPVVTGTVLEPAKITGTQKMAAPKLVGAGKTPRESQIAKSKLDANLTRVRSDG